MTPVESLYPDDWREIAERDFSRAELLQEEDPGLAGFCLQQAIEKHLKAFLLSKGWELRRVHNLESLLDDAVAYNEELEQHRLVCRKVSAFYMIERYPFTSPGSVTAEDLATALAGARQLIDELAEDPAD